MESLTVKDILEAIENLPNIGAKEALQDTQKYLSEIEKQFGFIEQRIGVLEAMAKGFKQRLQSLSYVDLQFNVAGIRELISLSNRISSMTANELDISKKIIDIAKED